MLGQGLSVGSCGPCFRSFRIRARSSASAREISPCRPLGQVWRAFGFFFGLFDVVFAGPGLLRSILGKSSVDFFVSRLEISL